MALTREAIAAIFQEHSYAVTEGRWGKPGEWADKVLALDDEAAPSPENFLGPKPSAACEASMHHKCDGYFTWAGPTLCTCDCHD